MIYIVLPAYNEEDSIIPLLSKIDNYFQNELHQDYKVIICNDGSSDNTLSILNKEQSAYPLEIITHKINRGLGEAIRTLFERVAEVASPNDVVIRMDCDVTHDPIYIKGMLDRINDKYDIVIASRFVKGGGAEGLSTNRVIISRFANYFMKLFFPIKGLKEYSSGFRAYKASVIIEAIRLYKNDFIQLKGLGFTCTLEKLVKFKMMGCTIGEAPMILRYDLKASNSKMVTSITTLGYFVLVILYYWPVNGWKYTYKFLKK